MRLFRRKQKALPAPASSRGSRDRNWTTSRVRIDGQQPKELLPVKKLDAQTARRCALEIARRNATP